MTGETNEEMAARIAAAKARGGTPKAIFEPATDQDVVRAHVAAVRRLGDAAILSGTERHLSYWSTVESNIRANLPSLKGKHLRAAEVELAEALANQGRFDEAGQYHKSRKREFAKLAAAIEVPDDQECDCDEYVVPVAHPTQPDIVRNKIMPKYQVAGTLYSGRHGGLVTVCRCLRCGHTNARSTLPATLAQKLTAEANHPRAGQGADFDILSDA